MSNPGSQTPKVFISYSWTSESHEEWVIGLATDLQESGVEVVLDKWDLREGADKYKFMERMVTDPSVKKVIVVCDRLYAEKADGRQGGVGTETQIISPELYEQVDPADRNQKFIPVVKEKDEQGRPYVPTYMKGRIYIDMSDPKAYSEKFEQLLRWIFDKPLHEKPPLGKSPVFIIDPNKPSLNTTAKHRFALEALRLRKGADAALRDYFDTFEKNLKNFRIQRQEGKEFNDQVVESIEDFLPYRDEAIEVFLALARNPPEEAYRSLNHFFERLLGYSFPAPTPGVVTTDWDEDNFKFIVNELFLYAVAALLKYERFEGVRDLTEQEYFSPHRSGMLPFFYLALPIRSFAHRNKRLNLNRKDMVSDFLTKRATLSELGLA